MGQHSGAVESFPYKRGVSVTPTAKNVSMVDIDIRELLTNRKDVSHRGVMMLEDVRELVKDIPTELLC